MVALSATFEFKVSMLVKTKIGPRQIMEQLFVTVAMVVVKTAVVAFVKQQLVGTFKLMGSIAVAIAVVLVVVVRLIVVVVRLEPLAIVARLGQLGVGFRLMAVVAGLGLLVIGFRLMAVVAGLGPLAIVVVAILKPYF